jgi:hypothetical protein
VTGGNELLTNITKLNSSLIVCKKENIFLVEQKKELTGIPEEISL